MSKDKVGRFKSASEVKKYPSGKAKTTQSLFEIENLNGDTLYSGYGASFKEVLEKAVKDEADLTGANLMKQDLRGANLENGCFYNVHLDGTSLDGANLKGSRFSSASLKNVHFNGANLEDAVFENLDLKLSKFIIANLKNTAFNNCTSKKDNFENAVLQDSDLEKINPLLFVFVNYYSGTPKNVQKTLSSPKKLKESWTILPEKYKNAATEKMYKQLIQKVIAKSIAVNRSRV